MADSKSANKTGSTVSVGSTSDVTKAIYALSVGRAIRAGVASGYANAVGTFLARDTIGVGGAARMADSVVTANEIGEAIRVGRAEIQFHLANFVNALSARRKRTIIIGSASQNTQIKIGVANESFQAISVIFATEEVTETVVALLSRKRAV